MTADKIIGAGSRRSFFKRLSLLTAAWPITSGYAQSRALRLTENGRPLAEIVRGFEDEYAAAKLADEFLKFAESISVLESNKVGNLSAPTTIYVGTIQSNAALAGALTGLGWRSEVEKLPEEGYLIRTGSLNGKSVIVLAGGDRTGAIYAASDLKNFYLDRSGGNLAVGTLNYTEVPKMPYRWFWNWDNRTNWDLIDHDDVYDQERLDQTKKPYSIRPFWKRPEAYITNMNMVVDYMSEHKLNGLIVWGFLRDSHGGVVAARRICEYALERGVRIIPGVNLDREYGGIYHQGNHKFNLENRAAEFPNLRTMDKDGNYVPRTLCMQKPENREWVRRAIRWLYDTFPIGGVNLEFAEHAACYTPDCVAARELQPGNESDFYKDLARIMPFVIKEVHERAPETWISYATYGGYTAEMRSNPPLHIRVNPPYAVTQWTLTLMLDALVPTGAEKVPRFMPYVWTEGIRPPGKEYIGLVHWNTAERGFLVDPFCRAARIVNRHGFKGLVAYGEESPEFPNIELNYLAFSEFNFNPGMTDEDFLKLRVAPLYGGEEAGRVVLEIARRLGPIHDLSSAISPYADSTKLNELLSLARHGSQLSSDAGKPRWDKLVRYMQTILRR